MTTMTSQQQTIKQLTETCLQLFDDIKVLKEAVRVLQENDTDHQSDSDDTDMDDWGDDEPIGLDELSTPLSTPPESQEEASTTIEEWIPDDTVKLALNVPAIGHNDFRVIDKKPVKPPPKRLLKRRTAKVFYNVIDDNYRENQCVSCRYDDKEKILKRCKKLGDQLLTPEMTDRKVCMTHLNRAKRCLDTYEDWEIEYGNEFGFYDDPDSWHRDWDFVKIKKEKKPRQSKRIKKKK